MTFTRISMARLWRRCGVTAGTKALLPLLFLNFSVLCFGQALGGNQFEKLAQRFNSMMRNLNPELLAGACAVIGIGICFGAMNAGAGIGRWMLGAAFAIGAPGLILWLT